MSFSQHLQELCRGVEGAVASSLMGIDGIEVETHLAEGAGALDLQSLLVEYSGLLRGAREAAAAHRAGDVDELSIGTDRLVTVARLVTPDYLMIVALRPEGNYGKARYLLRILAPRVRAEL